MSSNVPALTALLPGGPASIAGRGIVDILDATIALCGGKAMGLARLRGAGFAVPAAICLTTHVYRGWLRRSGLGAELTVLLSLIHI